MRKGASGYSESRRTDKILEIIPAQRGMDSYLLLSLDISNTIGLW